MEGWPPLHWWFIVLRALLVGAGVVLMAQLDTSGLLAGVTWIKAGIGGVIAAANAGQASWPEKPSSREGHG
jgi:hypothetical protein